jgi:hypothetical protein
MLIEEQALGISEMQDMKYCTPNLPPASPSRDTRSFIDDQIIS